MRAATLASLLAIVVGGPGFSQTPEDAAKKIQQAERNLAEALKDPAKVRVLECMGVKVYRDPQPPGHPPSAAECKTILHNAAKAGSSTPVQPPAPQRSPEAAQDYYKARYMLAGYFLRSGYACEEQSQATILLSFKLISSRELKKIRESFPKLTEEWMRIGAENFNGMAMKSGIGQACAYAAKSALEARQLPEEP